jgi:hypothetical protein
MPPPLVASATAMSIAPTSNRSRSMSIGVSGVVDDEELSTTTSSVPEIEKQVWRLRFSPSSVPRSSGERASSWSYSSYRVSSQTSRKCL